MLPAHDGFPVHDDGWPYPRRSRSRRVVFAPRGTAARYAAAISTPVARVTISRSWAAAIAWTGDDALELIYHIERPAGQGAWLELDNVSLY